SRPAGRRTRDRSASWSVAVDDLEGATPQCIDAQSRGRVSGYDGAVARGAAREPPEGLEARRERRAARVRAGAARRRDRQTGRRIGARAGFALGRSPARSPSGSALGQVVEPGADREPPPTRL